MKISKTHIILGLVFIVVVIFLSNPQLLGDGKNLDKQPLLSVVDTTTMRIPTDITCISEQDCIDYAIEQDPTTTNIQATCEDTCTFITKRTPNVEIQ